MVKDPIQYTIPGMGLAGRLLYVCLMVTLCLPLPQAILASLKSVGLQGSLPWVQSLV
jgi:hypothetical protein